jgi:hypothetical protein
MNINNFWHHSSGPTTKKTFEQWQPRRAKIASDGCAAATDAALPRTGRRTKAWNNHLLCIISLLAFAEQRPDDKTI